MKKIETIRQLKELSDKHSYYCSKESYFDLGFETSYDYWKDFLDEFKELNLDFNLVFRWDCYTYDDNIFKLSLFLVHQRKGRFVPITIENVYNSDVEEILEFIGKSKKHLLNLWKGIDEN